MTQNQLQYQRNLETERSNRASEAIKAKEAENDLIKALAAKSQASSSASQAKTAGTKAIWEGVLNTLKFVLPEAGDVVKAAASLFRLERRN